MVLKSRKVKKLDDAQQSLKISRIFPGFISYRSGGYPTWRGKLCPGPGSAEYLIKIQSTPKRPKVWVLEPALVAKPPHVFLDKSLCLYYRLYGEWTDRDFIADKIIPWTAEWLALYEIWLITDVWYGPEIKHTG